MQQPKKRENISLVKTLEKEIAYMEDLDQVKFSEEIEEKNEKLREIREQNLEGTLIRAKARWIEEGENPQNISVTWKIVSLHRNL